MGVQSGIWMSGGGLSVDGAGHLYVLTGNGTWDGTDNFGESVVKLDSALAVLDYGTPANYATRNDEDQDFGSSRAILFDSQIVTGTKGGQVWLWPQSNLGQLQGSGAGPAQTFSSGEGDIFGSECFLNSHYYVVNQGGPVQRFDYSAGMLDETPASVTSAPYFDTVSLACSSNGAASGTELVIAVTPQASAGARPVPGTFRVFDPSTDPMTELYSDAALGTLSKFAVPTIANGRIFVPTLDGRVVMYGITGIPNAPSAAMSGAATITGQASIQ
jgi:hypothetical protein